MKTKRIVDENLLCQVRQLPCLACASTNAIDALAALQEGTARSHAHHVISRGAGGGDTAENVMSLCHTHHAEWHQKGMLAMAKRYIVVRDWLESTGHLGQVAENSPE